MTDHIDDVDDDVLDALRYQLRKAFSTRAVSPFVEYGRLTPVAEREDVPATLRVGLLAGLGDGRPFDAVHAAWRAGEEFADILELSGPTSGDLRDRAVRTRAADDPDPTYLGDPTFRVTTIDLRDLDREAFR